LFPESVVGLNPNKIEDPNSFDTKTIPKIQEKGGILHKEFSFFLFGSDCIYLRSRAWLLLRTNGGEKNDQFFSLH
tara:strand:- start:38 stop:262 length:225 start_codon:yes stop_codon:yes gene_type:complete